MADDIENKEQDKPAQPASNGWQLINFDAFKNPPVWLAAAIYVLATLLALAILFLVAVGLYATFQIAYESVVGALKDRVEAAKVFFPILLALVGGPLLIWRVVTAHVQATAARHQANTAQEGFYTDLFTKAVEQLGATRDVTKIVYSNASPAEVELPLLQPQPITTTEPNLEVRLGAIYALERIAQDSERDHWAIMEVLCAYVRENSGESSRCPTQIAEIKFEKIKNSEKIRQETESKIDEWKKQIKPPRSDVQAAIAVIGRRSIKRREWEKKHAEDPSDPLSYRLDLRTANLQVADFRGLHFERAMFDGAHLDCATLDRGEFSGAQFVRCTMIGTSIFESNFSHAQISESSLVGAKVVWADMEDAHIAFAKFDAATLNYSKWHQVYCLASSFRGSNLYNFDCEDVRFDNCEFRFAELLQARLHRNDFRRCDMRNADFNNATLFGSDFSSSRGLTDKQVTEAFAGDESTKLPKQLSRPANWYTEKLAQDAIGRIVDERDRRRIEATNRYLDELRKVDSG